MGQPPASPLFGKDNLPVGGDAELGGHPWREYQKKQPTKALRIDGTFRVVTIHGGEPQVCHDGYLAIDSQGHPYPIDRKVFEETFLPLGEAAEAGGDLDLDALVERLSEISDRERGQLLEQAGQRGAGVAGELVGRANAQTEGDEAEKRRATLMLAAIGLVDQITLERDTSG